MSKIIASDSELYNHIVEMLSNGNFLQLNGKSINLTELNEYMNAQQQENERLNNIIKEVREYIDKFIKANYEDVFNQEQKEYMVKILQMLDKESELC